MARVLKFAPIQGKVLGLHLADNGAQRGGFGLQQGWRSLDVHLHRGRPNLQLEVDPCLLS